jgi:hypothetical protein
MVESDGFADDEAIGCVAVGSVEDKKEDGGERSLKLGMVCQPSA